MSWTCPPLTPPGWCSPATLIVTGCIGAQDKWCWHKFDCLLDRKVTTQYTKEKFDVIHWCCLQGVVPNRLECIVCLGVTLTHSMSHSLNRPLKVHLKVIHMNICVINFVKLGWYNQMYLTSFYNWFSNILSYSLLKSSELMVWPVRDYSDKGLANSKFGGGTWCSTEDSFKALAISIRGERVEVDTSHGHPCDSVWERERNSAIYRPAYIQTCQTYINITSHIIT